MDSDAKLTYRKRHKGSILVLVALSIVVLIAMTGLVVDLGYMYSVKAQLQNAADAAALAGAAKLSPLRPILQNYTAHYYAQRFAVLNSAAGEQVDVALNINNDTNGDIVVGCWTAGGSDIVTDSSCIEPNAVKVTARRTDESGDGATKAAPKQVSIFLGRILGDTWKQMSAKASAIAYLGKANVVPMAVNEYWRNSYPRSYVRKLTNIDGSTPTLFGNIFAIFGARAEDNNTPSNHSGYVVLDYRTTNFDGSINSDGTQSWYHILNPPSSVFSCSNCLAGTFNGPISPPTLNASTIQNEAESYLQNGYPDNVILPTAIKEEPRTLTNPYPAINYTNPTSECPFASVGYIRTSGSGGTSSTNYSPGDKIVTAVYDGLVQNLGAGLPSVITFVGYALIQVDGYSSKNPNQIGNPNFFEDKKNNPNSLYGHALDFVEPSSITTPPGTCDNSLFLNLRDMAYRGGTVHLVR